MTAETAETAETPEAPVKPERFGSADRAAEHLSVTRRWLIDEARAGRLPAHPLGRGKRKQWRFRLSELSAVVSARARAN
jgi:hypothetical protein